jgi:hypothetical protein
VNQLSLRVPEGSQKPVLLLKVSRHFVQQSSQSSTPFEKKNETKKKILWGKFVLTTF